MSSSKCESKEPECHGTEWVCSVCTENGGLHVKIVCPVGGIRVVGIQDQALKSQFGEELTAIGNNAVKKAESLGKFLGKTPTYQGNLFASTHIQRSLDQWGQVVAKNGPCPAGHLCLLVSPRYDHNAKEFDGYATCPVCDSLYCTSCFNGKKHIREKSECKEIFPTLPQLKDIFDTRTGDSENQQPMSSESDRYIEAVLKREMVISIDLEGDDIEFFYMKKSKELKKEKKIEVPSTPPIVPKQIKRKADEEEEEKGEKEKKTKKKKAEKLPSAPISKSELQAANVTALAMISENAPSSSSVPPPSGIVKPKENGIHTIPLPPPPVPTPPTPITASPIPPQEQKEVQKKKDVFFDLSIIGQGNMRKIIFCVDCPKSNPCDPTVPDPQCLCTKFKVGAEFDVEKAGKELISEPRILPLPKGCEGVNLFCAYCHVSNTPFLQPQDRRPCSSLGDAKVFSSKSLEPHNYCFVPRFWKSKAVQREFMWQYKVIGTYLFQYGQHHKEIAREYLSKGTDEMRSLSSMIKDWALLETMNDDIVSRFGKGIAQSPKGLDKTTLFVSNVITLVNTRFRWTTCARSHPVLIPIQFIKPCVSCANP